MNEVEAAKERMCRRRMTLEAAAREFTELFPQKQAELHRRFEQAELEAKRIVDRGRFYYLGN